MSLSLLDVRRPQRIRWYEFRKRSTPALFPLAYYFRPFTLPRQGRRHFEAVMQVSFDHLDRQTLIDEASVLQAQQHLLANVERKPDMIATQRRRSQQLADQWLAWCRSELSPERLRKLTAPKLVKRYQQYQQFYEAYSEENIYYWLVAADIILERCRQYLEKVVDGAELNHAFEVLITPSEPSYIQREAVAFARIVARGPHFSSVQVQQALARHSKKFGWVAWDYAGPQFFTVEQLEQRRQRLRLGVARQILRDDRDQWQTLLRSQRALEAKLAPKARALFRASREQALLQDDKKAVTTESHYYLHFLHDEAAKRLRTSRRQLYFMAFSEISEALTRGTKLPDGRARSAAGVLLIQRGNIEVASGALARRWRKTFTADPRQSTRVLKGVSASRGVCRGRVVLVLTQEDAKKVRRGDILVTQMTTPEFIHAMERSAAFVTDEGGLTSHAAIVAREMKKPCVIGTKVATKVFKTGDRVEVDATRGIVRKLG